MLKKILISVLAVLLIMIVIAGGLRYYVKICGEYMLPESGVISDADREAARGKRPEYIFALEDYDAASQKQSLGLSAVIGTYTDKQGAYFVIYNIEGKELSHGDFGTGSEDFTVCDIRNSSSEIDVLCIEDGAYKLYSIAVPSSGIARTSVKAEISKSEYDIKISDMFLPDGEMQYIALVSDSSLILYDTENKNTKNTYGFSTKSVISSAIYNDDMLIICGADSDDTETNNFSYGFAEAYSDDGELIWTVKLLNRRDLVSAAMECQMLPSGNIGIYGRYFDYSESDVILSSLAPEKYEEFKMYGHGSDYYIYTGSVMRDTGESVQSSAFITEISTDGKEIDTKVYSALNDFRVPSILQSGALNKLDSDGNFMLTIARAAAETSATYHITIEDTSVEIPSDIRVIYSIDHSGGIYAYMAESADNIYLMKYFHSAKEFAAGMSELRTALGVSRAADKLPAAMMWFALLSSSVIIIAAKNRWRRSG